MPLFMCICLYNLIFNPIDIQYFVLYTLNPHAETCREPHDFCIHAMIASFIVFASDFYRAGVVFVNTRLFLLCFYP